MLRKTSRVALILLYVLSMMISNAGLLSLQPPPQALAAPGPCPLDPVEPSAPLGRIGLGVVQLTSPWGTAFGGPGGGPGVDAVPGDVVTFYVELRNTDPTETATNVSGELIVNHLLGIFQQTTVAITWTWPGASNVLGPDELATGIGTYTVQPGDPAVVHYRLDGWGTYTTVGFRCDQQASNVSTVDPGPINVIGPGLTVIMTTPTPSAQVGDTITWDVTVTNQRPISTTFSADDLVFEALPCNALGTNQIEFTFGATTAPTIVFPGAVGEFATATFSCTMVDSYPDPLPNTITVNAVAGGIPGSFSDSVSIDKLQPSIRVTKTANMTEASVGDTITYTIRVENDGDVPLTNVTVVDTLTGLLIGTPTGLCPAPAPPGCTDPQNYTQAVQYTVQDTDSDPLINIVTAFGVAPSGTTVNANWTVSIDKTNPAIEVVANVSPTSQSAGNNVTYTFTVTNTSPDPLVGLTVDFPLCSEPGAVSGCIPASNNIILGSTSLVPGASTTGTFVYTVQGTEPDPFGYTPATTATARATTTTGTNVQDSVSVFLDITNSIVEVTKIPDTNVALRGDTITYTITVRNVQPGGSPDLTITSLTDSLLGDILSYMPSTIIAAGASVNFDVQYTVSGNDPDPLINIVTVGTSSGVSDSTSAIVDISDAQLFLTVTSTPPDRAGTGVNVTYDVGIANVGRVTLTDVTGTWQITGNGQPTQQFPIDFPGPGGATLSPGVLAPFQSAFGSFAYTIFDANPSTPDPDPDPLVAVVTITGTDNQGLVRTFVGTAVLDVTPTQLQVIKQADILVAAVGDVITYSFEITNLPTSLGTITDIELTDPMCAVASSGCTGNYVIIGEVTCGTTTYTGSTGQTIASLDQGECAYGEITYQVQASDLNLPDSRLENTAVISGVLPSLQPTGDASIEQVDIINPLVIEKTADRVIATDGQVIGYTITVRNNGSVNALTNIVINDPVLSPSSPIYGPFSLNPGEIEVIDATDNPLLDRTVSFVVDQPAIANTATATANANGVTVTADSEWTVEVLVPIAGEKTSDLAWAIIGDTVTYHVDLMNISDNTLTITGAFDVFTHLPGSPVNLLTQVLANRSGVHGPSDSTFAPGETTWAEWTYTVLATDPDEITNTFTIETNVGDFFDTYSLEIYSPFSIVKVPDRTFAVIGETIHYDYLVYNLAYGAMNGVTVIDDRLGPIPVRRADLGGAYTTAPLTIPAYPCVPPAVCSAYYLESDPSAANYTVSPADLAIGTITNTVTVSGRGPAPSNTWIYTEETAEVQVGNPLEVIKTGPPIADVGDIISYSIQVVNSGPAPITITDVIDDQFGGSILGTLTWPGGFGVLQPGQAATGTYQVTVPQNTADPYVNTALATGTMNISGTLYDLTSVGQAQVDITDPILSVDLIAPSSQAERGATITWTVLITNNGTNDIFNLTYSDSTGVAILVGAGNCPPAVPMGTTLSCTYDYTIDLATPDPFVNTLTVAGQTAGGIDVSASDQEIIDLTSLLFRVSKVASPGVAFIGDTITYTITITNSSGSRMDGVTAYDTLSGQVVLDFPDGTQGTVGSLNNNETATGIVTYTLSQADPSPLMNTVSASGTTTPGGNTLSDSTYTTVLISASQLLVDKMASPTVVQVGDDITYNIAITNIGQTRITGLQVSDAAVGLATDGSCTLCTVTTPLTATALNPFEVAFLSYTVTATGALSDPFVNTIDVTGIDPQGGTVTGTDTAVVDIITPGLALVKFADTAGASIGDVVTYTIQLTNLTGAQLTGIQVTDNDTGAGPQLISMSYNGNPPTTDPALSNLLDGETAIGVVFYTVTASTPNPFVNTVTVTNDQGITGGAAATIDIRNLGISVTKTPQVSSAVIGETVFYDIEVTNTSNVDLTNVVAIDQLSGLQVPLAFPGGNPPGVLHSGETATGTFQYTIPPTAPDPLQNRVSASGRAPSGVVVSSSGLAFIDIRSADIALSKTTATTTALVGDVVTYNFTVSNAGITPLTNVQVADPLCATASAGCTGGLVNLTFAGTPGTLGAAGSGTDVATGTITRTIQPSDSDPLINTAIATGETSTGLIIQDSDSATIQIAASQLVVTKTVAGIVTNPADPCGTATPSSTAQIGDTVAYNVLVQNLGGIAANIDNVQVLDTLTGSLMVYTTGSDTATIAPGGHASGCITTTITGTTPDPLVNTVVATGTQGGVPLTDTGSATISIVGGDLVVTNVPSQTTAQIGDTVTFNVTIRNSGPSTISGLTATSPHAGGAITLSTPTGILNPGQTATGSYTHTISGLDADPFQSTVTVNATAPGPVALTDQATATIDLVTPGIRLTKSATPTLASVGANITYSITVTNTGADPIVSVNVTDVLLGGDITNQFPPVGDGVGANPPPLAPGASITAAIVRAITSNDGDPVDNVASVTAISSIGTTLTDTSSAQVNLTGAGLTVILTPDRVAALDGDIITYTLDVINTSSTPVSNLTVNDTLVAGVTLPSTSLAAGAMMSTTYTHTVNAALDTDPIINTVVVAGTDALGVSVSDFSSATVAILDSGNIRVTVVPDRATALPTETINYLVTITNIGTVTLDPVQATADLPDGTTITLTLPMTVLLPGQSVTTSFSYVVRVNEISPMAATVTAQGTDSVTPANIYTDTATGFVELTTSSIDTDVRTTNCPVPCVAVVGDSLQFVATITNDGATTLTNVSLTSALPITFSDPASGLILPPGDSVQINFSYLVPLGVADPLAVEVVAQGIDTVGVPIMDNYSLLLDSASPRIGVTLTADRTIAPEGATVTYTAEIINSGTETLNSLSAIDSLFGPMTGQLPTRTLAPGASTILTFQHQIVSGDLDPMVNTLTVSGVTTFNRSVTDNDTYVVNVQRPELYITVTANYPSANVGDRIAYNVFIVNIGDGPIRELQGSYVPATATSGTGGQQRPDEQGGPVLIQVPLGVLNEGQSVIGSFGHVVTSGDNNPLTFRVTVTGQGLVGTTSVPVTDDALISIPLITVDASGNPIIVGTPIPGSADPEITKTTDQPFAVPGGLVTWTVTIRNPGTDPLSDIIITDTLTSNMTLENVTINNGNIESEGNAIVATTGVMQFNETAVMTIISRVDEDVFAGEVLQNTSCATSVGGTSSICDTASVRIAPDADLLPATGEQNTTVDSNTGANPGWLALAALLLLSSLLGINLKDPDPGTRLVITVALIAAAVVIIVVIAALVINLSNSFQGPGEEASTTTAVAGVAETPATTAETATEPPPTEAAADQAPTSILIPTALPTINPTITPTPAPPFTPQYARELFIPRLGFRASLPIVNIPLRNRTWDVRDLGQQVGFLEGTTWINEMDEDLGGNTVLAAHIQITEGVPGPFRDLDLLEVGDSVFVAESGTIYEYTVTAIDVVAPDDIEVTYPTKEPTLTLVTCTAWNEFRGVFAERLVVRATPIRSLTYQ